MFIGYFCKGFFSDYFLRVKVKELLLNNDLYVENDFR